MSFRSFGEIYTAFDKTTGLKVAAKAVSLDFYEDFE